MMRSVNLPDVDKSQSQSCSSPQARGGKARNKLQKKSPPKSSLPRRAPTSSALKSPSKSQQSAIDKTDQGPSSTSTRPINTVPKTPSRRAPPPPALKRAAKAPCSDRTSLTSPLQCNLSGLPTPTDNRALIRQTSAGITTLSRSSPLSPAQFKVTQSSSQISSTGINGKTDTTMQFPALPSTSRIRRRASDVFSFRSSAFPEAPFGTIPPKTDRCLSPGPVRQSSKLSTRTMPLPKPCALQPSSPIRPRVSDSSSSIRSLAAASNSSSSLRMLLSRRRKLDAEKHKGVKISSPLGIDKNRERQMKQAPNLGRDEDVDVEMWRGPRYEDLRAATPPIPVSGQPTFVPRSRSALADAESPGAPNLLEGSKKWSIFRSHSTQSLSPANRQSYFENTRDPPKPNRQSVSTISAEYNATSFTVIATNSPHRRQRRQTESRNADKSWSRRLLSFRKKSISTFDLRQHALDNSKKSAIPPPRPRRPSESIDPFGDSLPESPSFTDLLSTEAGSRIDAYGWKSIKPLPGLGRSNFESSTDLRRLGTRPSIGSFYSVLSEGGKQSQIYETEKDQQTELYNATASSPVNRVSQGSISGSNRTGKIPLRTSQSSSSKPTVNGNIRARNTPRLTAVTEEESDLSRSKPLPATPKIKCDAAIKPRRQRSQMILGRADHKPWWEEQNIPDSDLCLDLDNQEEDNAIRTGDAQKDTVLAQQGYHNGSFTHLSTRRSSSLDVSASSTSQSGISQDGADNGITSSPEKSILLTDIARSYVDERARSEERERRGAYVENEKGKEPPTRGAKMGKQIVDGLHPMRHAAKRSKTGSRMTRKEKWRFSVFEKQSKHDAEVVDARLQTSSSGTSTQTMGNSKFNHRGKSASASTSTLPESEKVKMLPLPLRLNATTGGSKGQRGNVTPPSVPLSERRQVSKVSTPPILHDTRSPKTPITKTTFGATKNQTPERTPQPQSNAIDSTSSSASPTSSHFWSDDQRTGGEQNDTPLTARTFQQDLDEHTGPFRSSFSSSDEDEGDEMSEDDDDDSGDEENAIINLYLSLGDGNEDGNEKERGVPPMIPERNPERLSYSARTRHRGISPKRASTSILGPFCERRGDVSPVTIDAEDEERRMKMEDEERHRRVARILSKLRET